MGYAFQFVTLAGFHALNASMFALARGYRESGMSAYVELQDREFELEAEGYTATRHQAEVGDGVLRPRVESDRGRLVDHGPPRFHRSGSVRGGGGRLGLTPSHLDSPGR